MFPLSRMLEDDFVVEAFFSLGCCCFSQLRSSTECLLMVWLSLLYLSLSAESETRLPLLEESCCGDGGWGGAFWMEYDGAKEFRREDGELRLLMKGGFSGKISLFGMLVIVPEIRMVG